MKAKKETTYYKALRSDKRTLSGEKSGPFGVFSRFDYGPYLPSDDKPGKWLPAIKGRLNMCHVGYHVTTDPLYWANEYTSPTLRYVYFFVVEVQGIAAHGYDLPPQVGPKTLARRIRLVRRVSRPELERLKKAGK
jgi:hypothetical protein